MDQGMSLPHVWLKLVPVHSIGTILAQADRVGLWLAAKICPGLWLAAKFSSGLWLDNLVHAFQDPEDFSLVSVFGKVEAGLPLVVHKPDRERLEHRILMANGCREIVLSHRPNFLKTILHTFKIFYLMLYGFLRNSSSYLYREKSTVHWL